MPLEQRHANEPEGLGTEPGFLLRPWTRAKGGDKLTGREGMPGAGLTNRSIRKVPFDMLALKPYWGKPAVRDFRGGDGNVGIIRSPLRAIVLPDLSRASTRCGTIE